MRARAACLFVFWFHAGNVCAQVAGGHPAWSPADDRVAFEQVRDGRSRVLILDLATQRVSSVGDPERSNHHPAWSPDGQRIAYSSERADNVDIFVWDIARESERRLTHHPARDETPAWSPDGRHVAFSSKRDDGGLHLVNLASGEVASVLPNTAVRPGVRPSWSPDGTELAFHAGVGDAREIFILHLRDRSVRRLTADDAADTEPHWSPDGDRILFSSRRDGGKRELYLMGTEGRPATRLTNDVADDADGSWSPTGDRVVFYSNRSGAYRLWLADLRTGVTEQVPYRPDPRARAPSSYVLRIRHAGNGVEILLDGEPVRTVPASAHPSEVELGAALQPGPNELTIRWRPEVEHRPPLRVRLLRRPDGGSNGEATVLVDWTSPKRVDVGKLWRRTFTLTVDPSGR